MEKALLVTGGNPLSGVCRVHAAKNAVLPILAAGILCDTPFLLPHLPDLSDVAVMCQMLSLLGITCKAEGDVTVFSTDSLTPASIPTDLSKKLRASVLLLGPMLARFGKVKLGRSGGCAIGARPIDLHLKNLEKLGAVCSFADECIFVEAPKGLQGTDITLSYPSVGATENLLMAATLAKGVTRIAGGAVEPEILDLISFLNSCGAKIFFDGAGYYEIIGVKRLHGAFHNVIPDRIEAATFLAAAAATGGEILAQGAKIAHLPLVLELFEAMGCSVLGTEDGVALVSKGRPKAFSLKTRPYPGFPTDLQAIFMTLASLAEGESVLCETVFEKRFPHVKQLSSMGACITVNGRKAVVDGVAKLQGASLAIPDLRAGGALLLAALAAEGESNLTNLFYLERGYDKLAEQLCGCGGLIAYTEDGYGKRRRTKNEPCRV